MDFNKVLEERRSVRKFKAKDISWENTADILESAIFAPSSGNVQNWLFIVVKDKENKSKLAESSKQSWIIESPILILVCSKNDKIKELYGDKGEKFYSIQNCAAAIENMLLKATDLGLDSCWVSSFSEKEIIKEFRLTEGVKPQAILAFGYGDEFEKELKRMPLENFVFFEEFGNKKRDFTLWPVSKHLDNLSKKLNSKK